MSLIEKHFGDPESFLRTSPDFVEADTAAECKRIGEQTYTDTVSEIYKSKQINEN